jgi:hypothetical protein
MRHRFHHSIEGCSTCAIACEAALAQLVGGTLQVPMARLPNLLQDCADICRLTTGYLARTSEMAEAMCVLCASLCASCADECDKQQEQSFRQCAQACRRCAEECRRTANGWLGQKKEEPTGGPYAA